MFTGIVEERGELLYVNSTGQSAVLRVRAPLATSDARPGDSIAVNGVCLTVTELGDGVFAADVMAETLVRTTLGALRPGDPVNLERAVPAGGRLGGHIMQGHVDGTGTVLSRTPGEAWEVVRFGLPVELARYVAEKGAIAVDGVSLTVTAVGPDYFEVGLIPTTLAGTTLGARTSGDPVNLEVDVLAKYVQRLISVEEAT
ncbi:MAG: riboflavin synthase [Actinobacteria bacterium]|nr:riboflavin synthase [Actinomycetota bacterium]MBI3687694.1 riboflavin synthase [Actinomycetota bacterium]